MTGTGADANKLQAFRWDIKGMVNPISDSLEQQYRNPQSWQNSFYKAYKNATDIGDAR